MKMARRYAGMVLALLGLAVLTASADDFWVKKDWKQWSKQDCEKMLQDSPWTKKWAKSQTMLSDAVSSVSGAAQEGAGGEKSIEMDYFIQDRSSLPVRQAIVRQAMIVQKYDQMDADHKKAFDDQSGTFLSKTYDDVIFLHVEYKSNVQSFERQMATYWQGIPDGTIPVDLYMITAKNERVDPVKFASPHNGAYFFDIYFPRLKNGEPVVQESDKSFSMQFIHPAIGTQPTLGTNSTTASANPNLATFGRERVLAEFKLDKMKMGGKTSF
jgi:hypothetical protein